jgi:Putative lumazine-binding
MKSLIFYTFLLITLRDATSPVHKPDANAKTSAPVHRLREGPSDKHEIQMKNFSTDSADIALILTDAYFKGIYEGDMNLLGSTFYSGTLLFGDVAGKPYFKTLAQYLDGVKNRQSPKDSGKPFKGEIISIEIIQSIAIAKVHVKMYDFNYFELLSFHKLDNKWVIVNKMIADVER